MRTRLLAVAAWGLAAWVAWSFAATPLRTSNDEWWHLKTGRWIADHGLPEHDIFTQTAADVVWHNHEWLTQWALWRVYALGEAGAAGGGWRAVILIKALAIVAAFVGLAGALAWLRRRGPRPCGLGFAVWPALAAALAAALARRTFYPRPPVVSYVLLAGVVWLWCAWRAGRLRSVWLWTLVPLFAVWATLHGGWMAGLVVCGAFGAEALGRAVTRRRGPGRGRETTILAALGVACVLATLINPYGRHLYALAGRVMGDAYLMARLGEMQPPDRRFVWVLEGVVALMAVLAVRPRSLRGWLASALAVAALHGMWRTTDDPWIHCAVVLPTLAVAVWRAGLPGWPAHALLVVFFAYQGLHHVRHLPLTALVLLPSLVEGLERWFEGWRPPARRRAEALGLVALTALVAGWTFHHREGPSYWDRNRMLLRGASTQPTVVRYDPEALPTPGGLRPGLYTVDAYPVRAVDFLIRAELPAPIWNGGNDAGYLIWRLAPERMRVFTDNRYDIYGGRFIREEHSVLEGWTREFLDARDLDPDEGFYAWDEVLDRWGIRTVFIPNAAAGNVRLHNAGWTRAWEDPRFNIWVRPDAPTSHKGKPGD